MNAKPFDDTIDLSNGKGIKCLSFVDFLSVLLNMSVAGGPRPDGYLIFASQEDAKMFIKDAYADRTGLAPDYYVNYDEVGWMPITSTEENVIVAKGATPGGDRHSFLISEKTPIREGMRL